MRNDPVDRKLKRLEAGRHRIPSGLVEVEVIDDPGGLPCFEAFDTLGYAFSGRREDLVDRYTGEVVAVGPLIDSLEMFRLAVHERERASVLVEALENIADNPLFHAGEETRELARRAIREFEEVCGG